MLVEITFEVVQRDVETWSDALLDAGALSVQAEDADAESPDEQALFGEPGLQPVEIGWVRTRLSALIDQSAGTATTTGPANVPNPLDFLARAARAIGKSLPEGFSTRAVADQDWVRVTQAQFEPIPVGTRLLITPSWHAPAPSGPSARIAIEMDPGLAFGTGSHPTTRLCLEWLDANLAAGADLIDYGCGSGILAIAACRLGARRVIAIDIDPQAVIATTGNALRNGLSIGDQIEVRAAHADHGETADIVIANILSNPLKVLAPMLCRLVRPGGRLVLSGVLARQSDEVALCYESYLPVTVWKSQDGWVCLAGRKGLSA